MISGTYTGWFSGFAEKMAWVVEWGYDIEWVRVGD